MNDAERNHIIQALKKGVRFDGRKADEFRPIQIKMDLLTTAEGSAMVTCGDTQVICGIKFEVGKPYPDSQEDGVLMVGTELLPMSNPHFESGPPGIDSIETARVVDRAIREGKSIDTKKLCIRAGELVWTVMIDFNPINYDGNLIDVGGIAALSALYSVKMPEIKDDKIISGSKTKEKLPMLSMPVSITIIKIGDSLLVDPTDAEQKCLDARLTVGVLEDGRLCSMQKGGDASLTAKDIKEMIELAVKKSHEIRAKIKEALK